MTQANYIGEETEKGPFDPSGHAMDDDDEVRIVDQPTTSSSLNKREKRPATSRNKNPLSSDKAERAGFKRRQDGKVVEMMGWFLELKEKEAEAEPVQQKGQELMRMSSPSKCALLLWTTWKIYQMMRRSRLLMSSKIHKTGSFS